MTSTPLTGEQKRTIKQLVDDGEIDAARKLLTKWGDIDTLAKINARYPIETKASPIPVVIVKEKEAPKPGAGYRRARNLLLFLLICILIAGVIYLVVDYQNDADEMRRIIESMN